MSMNASRRILAELTRSDEGRVDLGQAALLIAQEDYPDLEVRPYLARLDELARRAAPATQGLAPEEATAALVRWLFDVEGFRGNEDDYYDPRNSYLNEVLDRRLGIPITLAVVAMEVARRLGLPLTGVGLPGHFVLRYTNKGEVLFDPFRGGKQLTLEDCRALVSRASGEVFPLRREHLRSATKLEILLRILRNLKNASMRAEDLPRALAAVERIMILNPGDHAELRERGMILAKLGLATKALVDLETYLRLDPDAIDTDEVWEHVRAIRAARSLLN
jgi:regulator of sirC expression with transglutaminase-like and TPR domain